MASRTWTQIPFVEKILSVRNQTLNFPKIAKPISTWERVSLALRENVKTNCKNLWMIEGFIYWLQYVV